MASPMVANFNSQPREGGWPTICLVLEAPFKYFNSQPREGGWHQRERTNRVEIYFNSQPREGGWKIRSAVYICI